MKKILIVFALVTLLIILGTGSALAFHTQNTSASACFGCHSAHQGVSHLLLQQNVSASFGLGNVDVLDEYGK